MLELPTEWLVGPVNLYFIWREAQAGRWRNKDDHLIKHLPAGIFLEPPIYPMRSVQSHLFNTWAIYTSNGICFGHNLSVGFTFEKAANCFF